MEILWKLLWEKRAKNRIGTGIRTDAHAGHAISARKDCGIPVEDMWIFHNQEVLNKQILNIFLDEWMKLQVFDSVQTSSY